MLLTDHQAYRSRSTRGLAMMFTFVFLLLLIGAVSGLSGGNHHSQGVVVVGIAILVAALLGLAWSWMFFARMGVTISDDGIVVRNWFRQFAIPWHEIKSFDFGDRISNLSVREQLSSPVLQTYVVLINGHHRLMCGLSATRMNRSESKRRVQQLLDELEGERRQHVSVV